MVFAQEMLMLLCNWTCIQEEEILTAPRPVPQILYFPKHSLFFNWYVMIVIHHHRHLNVLFPLLFVSWWLLLDCIFKVDIQSFVTFTRSIWISPPSGLSIGSIFCVEKKFLLALTDATHPLGVFNETPWAIFPWANLDVHIQSPQQMVQIHFTSTRLVLQLPNIHCVRKKRNPYRYR